MAAAVKTLQLEDSRQAATRRLEDLIDPDCTSCLATAATAADDILPGRFRQPPPPSLMTNFSPWNTLSAVMTASGQPADDRPCTACRDA